MKIGLLMPSVLMAQRFADRIFAPKDLFISLVDKLVARGHTVYVYSSSNTKTKGHLVSGDPVLEKKELVSVKVRTGEEGQLLYRMNAGEYEVDLTQKAFAHAQGHGVDVMHIYMDSIARHLLRLSSIPTVTTLHDPLFPADSLEGWRFRQFADVPHVAISSRQKELYGDEFAIQDVVYHGVDVASFPFVGAAGKYMAFVGRLIAEKGIEDALVVSRKAGAPLHIATSDNYLETDYFKSRLSPLIESSDVTMAGYMMKSARDAWLSRAKAFLFPIHWEEPFGMVMIEAMACGTPVVAYNRGSVSEVVKDGVTGFIVDPDDEPRPGKGSWIIKKQGVEGLVEAIKRIGEIDRAVCRRHVEEHFTTEKTAEAYEQVYKKVIAK